MAAVDLSLDLRARPAPQERPRDSNRENTPHDNPEQYCRRSLFFPFVDHITQEKLHAHIHLTKPFLILTPNSETQRLVQNVILKLEKTNMVLVKPTMVKQP